MNLKERALAGTLGGVAATLILSGLREAWMRVSVEYGRSIPQVAEAVRTNVIRRVENLVGLRVTEVNIAVNNIFFPQQEQQQQQG